MATLPVIERVIDQINDAIVCRGTIASARLAIVAAMDAGLINHDDYSIDWVLFDKLSPHIPPRRRMTLVAFLIGVDGT